MLTWSIKRVCLLGGATFSQRLGSNWSIGELRAVVTSASSTDELSGFSARASVAIFFVRLTKCAWFRKLRCLAFAERPNCDRVVLGVEELRAMEASPEGASVASCVGAHAGVAILHVQSSLNARFIECRYSVNMKRLENVDKLSSCDCDISIYFSLMRFFRAKGKICNSNFKGFLNQKISRILDYSRSKLTAN